MAQQLSHDQAAWLAEILEAKAQQADEEGDADDRNTYNASAAALRRWLRDGGPQPPAAGRYAGLLDGVGGEAPAVQAPVAPPAEAPPAPEPPAPAEPPVMEPAVMESAGPPAEGVNGDGLLFGPAPVEVEAEAPPAPPAAPESAAAHELRRELDRARRALDELAAGDVDGLVSVRATVDELLARHGRPPEGEALAAEVATRVNRAIAEARALGDRYRAEGRYPDARRQYDVVLQLAPDDRHAREAGRAIDQAIVARMSDADRASLRRNLGERRDLAALEGAVRQAETLAYEDRLPSDLADLLREARAAFDEQRRLQGEMTTFARFGDLAARQKAVQSIRQEMLDGKTTIWDAGRGGFVSANDAVKEAQRFYREKSEDLANYELSHIERMLPGHPAAALAHLREVMKTLPPVEDETVAQYVRHFEPDTVARLLAPRADELEKMVEAQRQAADKVAEADAAADEMAALRLLLAAAGRYPGLIGLETRLELARNAAANPLAQEMEAKHHAARAALAVEQFDAAVAALDEADRIPGGWPEAALPAALRALKDTSAELRGLVTKDRKRRADFDRLNARIRADLLDPDKRGEAMELYHEVVVKYAALTTDVAELRGFVSQHQDTGEQLAQLRRHIQAEEWTQAKGVAETIQSSGRAGDAADEVKTLLDQAAQELDIAEAREHLAARRVLKAHRLLDPLYRRADAAGKQALDERLGEAYQTIKAALEEQQMEPLYRQAMALAKRPAPSAQLAALRLLRHVAGDAEQPPDPAWPAYALSRFTADAGDEAAQLRQTVRDALLPGILTAAARVRNGQTADNDPLVAAAADHAQLLREAALLDTAEEWGAADDLALFQGRIDAKGQEAIGHWDGAVALWQRLDRDFPRRVADDLRRARVEQAVRAVDRLIRAGQADEAQATLQRALDTSELGEAWQLRLKQADVYAAQRKFQEANGALGDVEGQTPDVAAAVAQKRAALRREESLLAALTRAEDERQGGRYKEALIALNNALQLPLLSESSRLRQARDAIYAEGSGALLAEAEKARVGASQEDKTQVVVRLAELREIEQLAGVPDARRVVNEERLQLLKAELDPSIRSTLAQAIAFKPTADTLDRSIEKATELSKRLQTFRQVAAALGVELGVLAGQLEQVGPRVSKQVGQLHQLRELLRAVDDADPDNAAHRLWDEAVVSGNFSRLENYLRPIQETGLDASPDALAFQERLDEWEELRETLMARILDITANFAGGLAYPAGGDDAPEMAENFGAVLQLIRSLRHMPPTRRDGRAWLQLGQDDYARIHGLMGKLLVIPDVYENKELRGWEDVEEAAVIRLKEVNAWTAWEYGYSQHMTLVGKLAVEAQALPATATRVRRRDVWLAVDAAAQDAQAALAEPVVLDGDRVNPRTRWAELVIRRAEVARQLAAQWRAYVQTQLPDQAQLVFPTAAALDQAARLGRAALAARLAEAEQIGPSDDAERKRLAHYRDRVLPTLGEANERNRGLRDWLRRG